MSESELFYVNQDLIEDINIIFDDASIAASSLDFDFDFFNEVFPNDHEEVSVKDIEKEDKSTQTPGSWESFPKYRRGKYKLKTGQKSQSERKKARIQEPLNPVAKETVPVSFLEFNGCTYCIINNE